MEPMDETITAEARTLTPQDILIRAARQYYEAAKTLETETAALERQRKQLEQTQETRDQKHHDLMGLMGAEPHCVIPIEEDLYVLVQYQYGRRSVEVIDQRRAGPSEN